MIESSINPEIPQQYLRREFSRRKFLKKASKYSAAVLGAVVLAKGIDPLAVVRGLEHVKERDGQVNFLLGNHLFPPELDRAHESYYSKGNLTVSAWTSQAQTMIDRRMRQAQEKGNPYFLMVDSATNQGISWPDIPHPNLLKRDLYPDKIHIIGADFIDDYGFNHLNAPPNNLKKLRDDLQFRYRQRTTGEQFKDVIKEIVDVGPERVLETGFGAALLATGVNIHDKDTKKIVLKMLGVLVSVGLVKVTEALIQGNLGSFLAGQFSDPDAQRIATAIGNLAPWTIGNTTVMLEVNARTAVAAEKALELSQTPPVEVNQQSINVDALYGPNHGGNLLKITGSQAYRHTLIRDYLREQFSYIDDRIKETYNDLVPHRDAILKSAANSILPYTLYELNVPWGKQFIPVDSLADFENNLAKPIAYRVCHSFDEVVTNTLKEFGVIDIPIVSQIQRSQERIGISR